jgi:hypothetical protein
VDELVQNYGAGTIVMPYKAFISYSHAADARLAPALRSALRRIGIPWYRRAPYRIFLDKSSLSANPALWNTLETDLGQSEYLLLLASTSSARSEWVERELDWWLTHRGSGTILILLTDGDIEWRPEERDFDWERTTALNGRLRGQFHDEPLWVDLAGQEMNGVSHCDRHGSVTPCCKSPRRCMAKPEMSSMTKTFVSTGLHDEWSLSRFFCSRR